jgi:uncharacterized C2H2 Zn-finger protein
MKTQWRCPNCDMSSSRHWNVRRHVERSHNSIGQPVSDQHMKQYLTKMNPQIPHFPLSYHYLLPTGPSSMFFTGHKQKNSPDKPYDFVDRLLEPLRKVVEFKNLLSQVAAPVSHQQQHNIAGSSTYYSTPSAATFNSSDFKNLINHQTPNRRASQDFIQIQPSSPPVDPNDILGYRGIVCNYCLDIEVEEVRFSKYIGKGGVVRMKHVCDPKTILEIYQHNNNPVDKSLQLKILEDILILRLKELVVNNWTKNQNYLFAVEVPNPPKDCIDLAIPADDYNNHWAARAIKNNHILLSDDEFTDFLQKVKNCTFAVFRIKWQGSVIYYWMGITNTPLSRLPDSSFDSSNQQDNKVNNK